MGHRFHDPSVVIEAHLRIAATLSALGQFTPSLDHLEQGLASYDVHQHAGNAVTYGQDPQVACLVQSVWVLWALGYAEPALQCSQEALEKARSLTHPHTLAYSLLYVALFHVYCREPGRVQAYAEELMALSEEHRFAYRLAQARILRGWALAMQSDTEDVIAQMQEGLTAVRATGAEVFRPSFLALLADVYRHVGLVEDGLQVIQEALAVKTKTSERFYEAELYRLEGELLLSRSSADVSRAEARFHQAMATAQQQEAKALELRAAISLCRVWHRQDKIEHIHPVLSPLLEQYAEGLTSGDLPEARMLLGV